VYEQVQRQEQEPVVVVATQAAADLLVTTLRVHDVEATTTIASVYPSLDWVDGIAVTVVAADADRARRLLRELGHDPVGER
jgi:hypothetical protein